MRARAQTKRAFDKLQYILACYALHIGSKIFRAVVFELAHHFYFWEILLDVYPHKGIGLVVFKHYVVRRLVFFYEIVFKHQRLYLVGGDYIFKICNMRHQTDCLSVLLEEFAKY